MEALSRGGAGLGLALGGTLSHIVSSSQLAELSAEGVGLFVFDRMIAVGATPVWPRPEPPPSLVPHLVMLVGLAGAAFAGAWYVRSAIERRSGDDRAGITLSVAVDGRPSDAGRLAYWHLRHHDENAALAPYARAARSLTTACAARPR